MPPKDVVITLNNGTPQANPDSVTLSKGQGHTIMWHNNAGRDVIIRFNRDTPFEKDLHPYEIKKDQQKPSGGIVAQSGTTWSYTITLENGPSADPQVIIDK